MANRLCPAAIVLATASAFLLPLSVRAQSLPNSASPSSIPTATSFVVKVSAVVSSFNAQTSRTDAISTDMSNLLLTGTQTRTLFEFGVRY